MIQIQRISGSVSSWATTPASAIPRRDHEMISWEIRSNVKIPL